MRLKFIFEFIGAMVFAALMIAMPILTTCSFFCGWAGIIKYWLTILTIFEWLGLTAYFER